MKVERELGDIAISIGTAIPIEKLMEELEGVPEELWINTRTLVRNFVGCMKNKLIINEDDIFMDIVDEMGIISRAVEVATSGKTDVIFYYCTYSSLPTLFNKAILRGMKTSLQFQYNAIETKVCEALINDARSDYEVNMYDTRIVAHKKYSYIITHNPVDLLSKKEFNGLVLLESHTGKKKRENLWNTKLTNGKNYFRLPFNAMTISIYGDSGNHFGTMPMKIKKAVYEIAELNKWSTLTTNDKIVANLNKMKDQFLADTLKQLLRVSVK